MYEPFLRSTGCDMLGRFSRSARTFCSTFFIAKVRLPRTHGSMALLRTFAGWTVWSPNVFPSQTNGISLRSLTIGKPHDWHGQAFWRKPGTSISFRKAWWQTWQSSAAASLRCFNKSVRSLSQTHRRYLSRPELRLTFVRVGGSLARPKDLLFIGSVPCARAQPYLWCYMPAVSALLLVECPTPTASFL